jgi:peptidoglycan/LPS O-acetylase OafA/YrhL
MKANTSGQSISIDLSWIDMLKGIAIIGVILDNVSIYMRTFVLPVGPFVQVFFILSGFGLTVTYLKQSGLEWSWKRWAWRRITKIVMPYAIFVGLSFVLGTVGAYLHASVDMRFSWKALLAYLTFAQNFCPSVWVWNSPLWFMPVIIGLYISFPVLLKILAKWGPRVLLLIAVLVTYGTRTIAVLAGAPKSHGADLFTFWVLQFALGIVLAHVRETAPQKLDCLIGFKAFLIGLGLMACSWALTRYVPLGRLFNDPITSVGVFLTLLNLGWASRKLVPISGKVLIALSSKSYLMYLVHYPIMAFLLGPPLRVYADRIIVLVFGVVYIVAMFLLSCLISQPIDRLVSWAYNYYRVD